MIDHVGLPVSDYARSKEFYSAALAPLGFELAMEFGGHAAGFAGNTLQRRRLPRATTARILRN